MAAELTNGGTFPCSRSRWAQPWWLLRNKPNLQVPSVLTAGGQGAQRLFTFVAIFTSRLIVCLALQSLFVSVWIQSIPCASYFWKIVFSSTIFLYFLAKCICHKLCSQASLAKLYPYSDLYPESFYALTGTTSCHNHYTDIVSWINLIR